MKLDELRDKARLTDEDMDAAFDGDNSHFPMSLVVAAAEKAIKMMMEEFKTMVDAGEMASDALHSFGYGECDGAWAIDTALATYAALQEEIDHV